MITGRPKKPVNILLVIRAMRVRMPHCELKWEMLGKDSGRISWKQCQSSRISQCRYAILC